MDARLIAISPQPFGRRIKIASDNTLFFFFYLSDKIRLDVHENPLFTRNINSYFSLKNNEKNIYKCRLLQL